MKSANNMLMGANRFVSALARRKTIESEGSQLARVLTLVDLTALGVGSTLGLGVYVLAGAVAKTISGPAVCISFLVAAIASAFAGLCYAEFAARVPKAGSAYVYSYVTVGEFVAFIIGWNLILEYAIGTASVARGLSGYINALSNSTISKGMLDFAHMNVGFLAKYPDFLAFGFVCLLTALLSIGVKESSRLNNLFTALNLTTVLIVIIAGSIKADPHNWNISKEELVENKVENAGDGGFFPFGFRGMMAGAAQCFYGFVGFDAVATTGEEAKNPQRNIPLAIVFSLIIIFLSYFGISAVLTLMLAYYEQDADAPFPHAFERLGWYVIKWIVTSGAVIALCASLLGAMFPLPRVIYAMAKDGLIFKSLSGINEKTKTPIAATVLSGLLVGVMAILFDTDQLINMMSIGTLLAYSIVAMCVLILRYQPDPEKQIADKQQLELEYTAKNFFRRLCNLNRSKDASTFSSRVANYGIIVFAIVAAGFDAFIIWALDYLSEPLYFVPLTLVTIILIIIILVINMQPIDEVKLSFKAPWLPVVPCISVLMNVYLMLQLDGETWIRFIVWLIVGFIIYFAYGIRNSVEKATLLRKSVTNSVQSASAEKSDTTQF